MPNKAKFTGVVKKAFASRGQFSTPKQRKEEPGSEFLMPTERKFPYKVEGKISCQLLKAAIVRAGQTNRAEVKGRAQKLYQQHCASIRG